MRPLTLLPFFLAQEPPLDPASAAPPAPCEGAACFEAAWGRLEAGAFSDALALTGPACAQGEQLLCVLQLVTLDHLGEAPSPKQLDDACRSGFPWACEQRVAQAIAADDAEARERLVAQGCAAEVPWRCAVVEGEREAVWSVPKLSAASRETLEAAGLEFALPPGFKLIAPPENPHLSIQLSMRDEGGAVEVHYHVFDIEEMAKALASEGAAAVSADALYQSNFMVNALNLSGGRFTSSDPFPLLAVRSEFNASWGAVTTFPLAEGFADFKQAMLFTVHRDGAADLSVVITYDDPEAMMEAWSASFHAMRFADPIGLSGIEGIPAAPKSE